VTKVIVTKLRPTWLLKKKGRKVGAPTKLARRPDGRQTTVYIVDSGSKTFDDDLVRAFSANIAAERRANSAAFGSPDGPQES